MKDSIIGLGCALAGFVLTALILTALAPLLVLTAAYQAGRIGFRYGVILVLLPKVPSEGS